MCWFVLLKDDDCDFKSQDSHWSDLDLNFQSKTAMISFSALYQVAWKIHPQLHDPNTEAETVCPMLLPSLLESNSASQSPTMPLDGLTMPTVCTERERNELPVPSWLKWPFSVSVICSVFEGQRHYGQCPHRRQMALRLRQGPDAKWHHHFCSQSHCRHRLLRNGSQKIIWQMTKSTNLSYGVFGAFFQTPQALRSNELV